MAASEQNPKPLPTSAAQLQKIAENFGTPYQLYDESHMVDNVKALIAEFKSAGFNFTQFYAVKALPNPAILKLLVDAGCGLDCSSTAELYIARKLGVPGNQIMYTSNYTSAVSGIRSRSSGKHRHFAARLQNPQPSLFAHWHSVHRTTLHGQ
mgnify:CR=1 FL=1